MPLKTILRNTFCSAVILVQVASFPALGFAQEVAPESTTSTSPEQTIVSDSAPTSGSSESAAPTATVTAESSNSTPAPAPELPARGATNTGPTSPTGASANTYTQNADGTWSNDYYTWDPVTKQTSPNTPQDYSYNPATGMWDTTEYVYSPEKGTYIPNVRSVSVNPNAPLSLQSNSLNPLIAGLSVGGTGPNSNNSLNLGSDTIGNFNLFFNGAISNNIYSTAQSGNALVQGNTLGGDALSGDATAIANLLNMLQSSWLGSSEIATFINTIDGNVFGDLLIDPSQLAYALSSNNSNIDVNVSNNGVIDNNVNLVAQSGDATVDGNTQAGNAVSGDALAIANLINMINSVINSGRSFIGMINITGNLDGDILLPAGVLQALLSNTGPNSTNTIGGTTNSDTTINSDTNRTINNNVDANAASGDATLGSNTLAGNANTGSASTSINTMNLVGQNISGKNGLLVFVNVLGHWYGMVIGPAQTTATITSTGPASTNTINGNSNQSLTVNATENSLINNDISISTQSGDAAVTNNTQAGNATTGNTESAVNLLNVIDSNINLSDWFGILFINVFGNWFGDFGNDTAHGGFSQSPPPATFAETAVSSVASGGSNPVGQVFNFVARTVGGNGQLNTSADQATTVSGDTNQNTAVFGNTSGPASPTTGTSSDATINASQLNWGLIAGIIGVIATIMVLAREYILALREEQLTTSIK